MDKDNLSEKVYAFRVFKDRQEKWDTRMFLNANFKLKDEQKTNRPSFLSAIDAERKDERTKRRSTTQINSNKFEQKNWFDNRNIPGMLSTTIFSRTLMLLPE